MTNNDERLEVERAALFEFALNATIWMQHPTDRTRDWLVATARDVAGHTGTPERFEAFADWLEQQPTDQDQTGGAQ